ncbi:hypothetical protein [Plantactinospora sp. B24E8]|uniref:hypothetical protein n=1 Tax=Plantactinospora sp. B24E8 TaxID=3153567 RepID=UPI00325C987B
MASVLTPADLVWNRALSDQPGRGVGDRHLHAMAKPYGRIMGSGTSAVADTCTPEEILRAADAFDYLGLTDLAELTRRLTDADFDDGRERRLNHAFFGLENGLERAFHRRYAAAPDDFEPPPLRASPAASSPQVPPGPTGRASKVCSGTVVVHELNDECTRGVVCARRQAHHVPHEEAVLHRGIGCALCPSGPDWAR